MGQETVGGVRRTDGGVGAGDPLPHPEGGEPHQGAAGEGEAGGEGDDTKGRVSNGTITLYTAYCGINHRFTVISYFFYVHRSSRF